MSKKWRVKNNGHYLEVRKIINEASGKTNSISIFCYDESELGLKTNFERSEKLAQEIAEFLNNKKQ